MANNVGTPRFYVNIAEYLSTIGYTEIHDVFRLNPTSMKEGSIDDTTSHTFNIPMNILSSKGFAAFLGHDGTGNFNMSINYTDDIEINAERNSNTTDNNSLNPELEGFSLRSLDETNNDYIDVFCSSPLGSIVVGTYYDMPHSPDLSLKLSVEMDGVKNIQTKGGATLSNATYTKPADWGSGGAWQLGDNQNYRNGRRVWDLSFSYLSDTDVMPVLGIQNYDDAITTDILDGTDFFSQVWNKTMGGHLPFIFQADNSINSPDGFAICRFDMNSLVLTQVGINLYNCSLKIRESW
tara:strand:+ start:1570 stop:2451 length:882 start_codon:yes stop_codon:yes gene_type:complete